MYHITINSKIDAFARSIKESETHVYFKIEKMTITYLSFILFIDFSIIFFSLGFIVTYTDITYKIPT